mgnify:CR=1 FL=1
MRLLELFSGTGSMGKAFRAAGWEVTSLDIDPAAEPTICCDIMDWRPDVEPGHYDFVWASPVCTEFLFALTTRPRRLDEGDRLVRRALELIRQLRPATGPWRTPAPGC